MCHHSMLLQAMQNRAVLSHSMLHCVTWHCDKPHSIALCQSTPHPCVRPSHAPNHQAAPQYAEYHDTTLNRGKYSCAKPHFTL